MACNCCNQQIPPVQPTPEVDLRKFIEEFTPHVSCCPHKICSPSDITQIETQDIEDGAVTWQKLAQEVQELILLRQLKYNGDGGLTISIDGTKYNTTVKDGVLELTSYE